jgi:hypothetical protein
MDVASSVPKLMLGALPAPSLLTGASVTAHAQNMPPKSNILVIRADDIVAR